MYIKSIKLDILNKLLLICSLFIFISCHNSGKKVSIENDSTTKKIKVSDDELLPQMNLKRTFVTFHLEKMKTLSIEVQIAETMHQQEKGLMYRKSLPMDEGMLFPYSKEQELGFYMANCYISLDMIFLDRNKTVIGILKNMKPFDSTVRSIGKPSQYVIEVNGGFASKHHIDIGTKVTLKGY